MTTTTNSPTFNELCKQLGDRMNCAEAAMTCYRAHAAYEREYPDTAHGKGNKSDRDKSSQAFYKKAAEVSGVAPATISALLQVGKTIASLPEPVQRTLASTSLGKWMTGLRKLAAKKFATKREQLITEFARHEREASQDSAMSGIKSKLGIVSGRNVSRKGRKDQGLAKGEYVEIPVEGSLVRITVRRNVSGRVYLTHRVLVVSDKASKAAKRPLTSVKPMKKAA